MKKALCTLFLCLIVALSYAQSRTAYCEVKAYPNLFNKGIAVSFDFGELSINKAKYVLDKDGQKVIFKTKMQVMNYMSKRDWTLVHVYEYKEGVLFRFILSKKIENEDEVLEGLRVITK